MITHNLLGAASGANVGTYRLYGTGNIATDNAAFDGARFADAGVAILGNRTIGAPAFDAISCGGFRTRDASLAHYGRYGN